MFKRLLISLLAVSLVAMFTAEAANAAVGRYRRSVGVTASSLNPGTFVTSVFGLPDSMNCNDGDGFCGDCGEVRGELYCAQNDSPEARLACDIATGDSAARVLILDKDAIRAGAPPNFFTESEVNLDIKDFDQRAQLRGFATRARSNDPAEFIISLPTGKKSNAGFHAITDLSLIEWKDCGEGCTLSDNDALRRFFGDPENGFRPDDGFGISDNPDIKRDEFIHKVPGIVPLFGPDLDDIVGETICAAVKHPQVKGNSLKGKYLGLVAFKALERSDSLLKVEVLNANDVCGLPLYINTPPAGSPTACLKKETGIGPEVPVKIVFAPAFPDGDLREGEGKFPAEQETLSLIDGIYTATVEVKLDDDIGQILCEEAYPDNSSVDFVDFIPIDRGNGPFAEYAFTARSQSNDNEDLSDAVICGESIEGAGNLQTSRYGCKPLDQVPGAEIPTCSFDCGPNYPDDLTGGGNWNDFLDVVDIGADNCQKLNDKDFTGKWDFAVIGMEAGHQLLSVRNSQETILFDSNDCASMGLKRRVDFDDENLVLRDTNPDPDQDKVLNPYDINQFALDSNGNFVGVPGSGACGGCGVDIYMCEIETGTGYLSADDPIYPVHPLKWEDGQVVIFFNDYHPSQDYDDFVLIGKPVE